MTSHSSPLLDQWQQAIEHGTPQQAGEVIQRMNSGSPINSGVRLGMLLGRVLGVKVQPQDWAYNLIDPDWISQAKNGNWVRWVGGFEGRIDWERAMAWRKSLGVSDRDIRQELVTGWCDLRGEYLGKHYNQANTSYQAMEDLLSFDPTLLRDIMGLDIQKEAAELQGSSPQLCEDLFYLSCRDTGHWLERSGVHPILVLAGFIERNPDGKPFEPDEDTGLSRIEQWCAVSPERLAAWDQLKQLDLDAEQAFLAWQHQWVPGRSTQDAPLLDWCQGVLHTQQEPPGPSPMSPYVRNTTESRSKNAQLWAVNFSGKYPQRNARALSKVIVPLANGTNTYWKPSELPLDPLMVALHHQRDWALEKVKTEQGARHVQDWLDRDERSQNVMLNSQLPDVIDWILDQPAWQSWRDGRGNTVLDHFLMYSRHNVRHTTSQTSPLRLARTASRTKLLRLARKCPEILANVGSKDGSAIEQVPVDDTVRAEMKQAVLGKQMRETRKTQRGKKLAGSRGLPRM